MATIIDVARMAGVSTSTVSYALSGKRPVRRETQLRIERAIASLGYRPHAGARALAGRRTRVLGLVAPRCDGPGAAVVRQFVNGVLDESGLHGHDVMLLNPAEGDGGLRRTVGSAQLDGVILMDVGTTDDRPMLLTELGAPTVVIGLPEQPGRAACVDLDFAGAAALAVRHLSAHGRRRLALMASPSLTDTPPKSFATRTRDGFVAAAAAHADAATVLPCRPSPAAVRDWLRRIGTDQPGTDGIVVQNEAALPHLLRALDGRTPGDVSVIAICPRSVADGQETPVSFIDLPATELGAEAARMLLRRLEAVPQPAVALREPLLTEQGTCTDRTASVTSRIAGPIP